MRRPLSTGRSYKDGISRRPLRPTKFPERVNVRGIEIELVRKDVKNLNLRVYPPDGKVKVSVPWQLSADSVIEVLERRIGWIEKQQRKVSASVEAFRYVDGEKHWFEGRLYELSLARSTGRPRVEIVEPSTVQMVTNGSMGVEKRRKLLEEWYRGKLRLRAGPYFDKWAEILGVSFDEWRIKRMSTRWGSCNVRERRIWLSLELAKKSDECLEYVVVHELTHLLEPGHGPRFVARLDSSLPSWREMKAVLNGREPFDG